MYDNVITKTDEELREWRERLLRKSRFSYEELRERAEAWFLTQDERCIWETIDSIDWMLSGE